MKQLLFTVCTAIGLCSVTVTGLLVLAAIVTWLRRLLAPRRSPVRTSSEITTICMDCGAHVRGPELDQVQLRNELPQISHGLCYPCWQSRMDHMDRNTAPLGTHRSQLTTH